MPFANLNPYYAEILESVRMKSLLHQALKTGNKQNISIFVKWANDNLIREPSAQMFILLALAYQSLEEHSAMCNTIVIGNSIYPNNDDLLSGYEYCKSNP
jgi:hypothetical protein